MDPFIPDSPAAEHSWDWSCLGHAERSLYSTVLKLLKTSQHKKMFAWAPHPWFMLEYSHKTKLFHQTLRAQGAHIYAIFGGRTPLDLQIQTLLPRDLYICSLGISPFEPFRSKVLHVVDDIVLTTYFDNTITQTIDGLFAGYRQREDVPGAELTGLRRMPARITHTLTHDRYAAGGLKQQFCRHFGFNPENF